MGNFQAEKWAVFKRKKQIYSWSSFETVAAVNDVEINSNPSLTMDILGKLWVAWEFRNIEIVNQNKIKVRCRTTSGSYGAISSFSTGTGGNPTYYSPSISGNRNRPSVGSDLSVAWHKSTNEVQKVSYVDGAWGSVSTLASSNQTPQLVFNESGANFDAKIGFSRSTTGSVYALTPLSFVENGGQMEKNSTSTAASQYVRSVVTQCDEVKYHVEFGNIILLQPSQSPKLIPLVTLADTIPVTTGEEILPYLRSEPFIASEQSELSLQLKEYVLKGKNEPLQGKEVTYKLEFVEFGTDNVLYTMSVTQLSEKKKTIDVLPYTFGATGNKQIYVRLSITPSGTTEPLFTIVNDYIGSDETELNKNGSQRKPEVVDFLPKEYHLQQNYPNPFNPSTTISFGIPKEGMVTLKIYDMLGKDVAEVVNGHRSAGKYSVEFNSGGLSSGMYIYKLTSGTFSETRKMILMK